MPDTFRGIDLKRKELQKVDDVALCMTAWPLLLPEVEALTTSVVS